MKSRSILSMNGIALTFILSAFINSGKEYPLVLVGTIPLVISLMTAIYLLTIKGRNQTVLNLFIGADPKARQILTNKLKAKEEMLNGYLLRCEDLKNDNVAKSKHIWITSVVFVAGVILLLIAIAISIGFPDMVTQRLSEWSSQL